MSATKAAAPRGPRPHIGPRLHVGKAILAFLIADLLLWSFELIPALTLPSKIDGSPQSFDALMLLTPLVTIPMLAGPPALLGLGLHALTGQRLTRPLLLLALLAIAAWWGVTNGQTFLAPDYVTAHTPQDGSGIPGLVPFDLVMLALLAAPGMVWAVVYVGMLGR